MAGVKYYTTKLQLVIIASYEGSLVITACMHTTLLLQKVTLLIRNIQKALKKVLKYP